MAGAPGACRMAFVTASWTIRYAVAPSAGAGARGALDDQGHVRPRRPRILHHLVQPVDAGRRGAGRLLAQQPQRAVHLAHRAAAEGRDGVRGLAHALVAGGRAQGLRLDDHQAHVVPDGVVQLPGDPQPLLRRRPLREELPLARAWAPGGGEEAEGDHRAAERDGGDEVRARSGASQERVEDDAPAARHAGRGAARERCAASP